MGPEFGVGAGGGGVGGRQKYFFQKVADRAQESLANEVRQC